MNVSRNDRARLDRANRTDEGYIVDRSIVTRTGVFAYRDESGGTHYELRHPDDVFAADSLVTLSMLPVTFGHPAVQVNADNAKDLSVGHTGERAEIDGANILTAVKITDGKAVTAVDGGTRELSLGYRVDLVEEAGQYNGASYTHRQTNIRYNHLAIVDRGRMGNARLNVDGEQVTDEPYRKDTDMPDKLIDVRLDTGISYQAAPEVAHALETLKADAATATNTIKDLTARADKAEGERDAALGKVKALEANDGADKIAEAVASRIALVGKATAAGLKADGIEALSDRAIREAVIKMTAADLDLADKSDDYIAARFDAATEQVAARGDALQHQRAIVTPPNTPGTDRGDSASARENMIKNLDYRTREAATN